MIQEVKLENITKQIGTTTILENICLTMKCGQIYGTLNVKVVVRKSEKFFYHSGCQILLRTWLECQWQAASLMRSIH